VSLREALGPGVQVAGEAERSAGGNTTNICNSRHVLVSIYTAQAALQLIPLTSQLFAPLSIWSQLSVTECYLFLLTAVSYSIGAQCYAHGVPRLWPSTFGFHELWHVLVVFGHLGTYSANCCLLLRIA